MVAPPRSTPRRRISWASVRTILAPLMPIGCPRATAPPFTFTMSAETPSTFVTFRATAANASFTSINPRSWTSSPAFFSAFWSAMAGPVCRYANRSAAMPSATISASGGAIRVPAHRAGHRAPECAEEGGARRPRPRVDRGERGVRRRRPECDEGARGLGRHRERERRRRGPRTSDRHERRQDRPHARPRDAPARGGPRRRHHLWRRGAGRRPGPPAARLGSGHMADDRFELPRELEEFRGIVRQIAEERIAPRAAEIDETDEWPEDVYKVLVDNDLMAVGYPEEL